MINPWRKDRCLSIEPPMHVARMGGEMKATPGEIEVVFTIPPRDDLWDLY